MTTERYDDVTQALIAHRVLEAYPAAAPTGESLSAANEQRLAALMLDYTASTPERTTTPHAHGRAGWLAWAGVGLAAAVVLAVVLRGLVGAPAPLGTHYELAMARELAHVRSSEARDELYVYREDRALELWLRPVDGVDGPVAVEAYARRPGELHRLSLTPSVMGNGVIHVVTTVRALGIPLGEWELVFVVGRAGALPALDALPATVDGAALPYDVQTTHVRIVSSDEPLALP